MKDVAQLDLTYGALWRLMFANGFMVGTDDRVAWENNNDLLNGG